MQHTHNAGALFQAFLKRMDERPSRAQLLEAKRQSIEVDVSPVLAQDPQPVDNQGLASDRISGPGDECVVIRILFLSIRGMQE